MTDLPLFPTSSHPKLLLFDVDGTLLRTSGAGLRAMERAGKRLFGGKFNLARVQPAGHLDTLIFAEATAGTDLADNPAAHQAFRQTYLAELAEDLQKAPHQVYLMPGIRRLLQKLRHRHLHRHDLVLGLLTGNYQQAVPIKFKAVGLDINWFPIGAFAEDGSTRQELVQKALIKFSQYLNCPVDPHRVLVIGDTPRDIAAAKSCGCATLAVATGPFDLETLRKHNPDILLENFRRYGPLTRWIDADP